MFHFFPVPCLHCVLSICGFFRIVTIKNRSIHFPFACFFFLLSFGQLFSSLFGWHMPWIQTFNAFLLFPGVRVSGFFQHPFLISFGMVSVVFLRRCAVVILWAFLFYDIPEKPSFEQRLWDVQIVFTRIT